MSNDAVGKRVALFREKKGLKQMELAERLGVSKFHMNRIENGERGLSSKLGALIASELGVSMDDIFLNNDCPIRAGGGQYEDKAK